MNAPYLRRRAKAQSAAGFVFLDVVVGLGLLGLIAIALITTVGRQHRAAQKLSDTRAAARLADDALTSLRFAEPVTPADQSSVSFTRLPDAAPAGQVWLRATARIGDSDARVVGLVSTDVASTVEGGKP